METQYKPKYPLQTLSKALDILNFIKDSPSSNGITLAFISKSLDLSKSSTHRILDTLLQYGFVEKSEDVITTYRLGWGAYKVGSCVPKYHTLNSSNYAPSLEILAEKLKRTATLNVINDYSSMIMYKVDPNSTLPSQAYIGQRTPLYATASGKLFMLNFTNEEIRGYFKETDIKKYTSNTILNYIDFLDELNKIKFNDHSFDNCEYKEGTACIAMPVRDYTRKIVAAISITDTSENMTPSHLEEIIPKLKSVCTNLSRFLGHW